MSWIARAARSFQSAVRACPSSSMHVQTTAAPNSRASRRNVSSRVPVAVALLEVDGVEHRPAADPRQRGSDDGALGRVDHERHARLRGEPAGDLGHVGDAVGAGVVDADVDEVRALLDLFAGHRDARVPVAVEHRLAELLRPVGVRPLADDEERRVLVERDGRVDGRGRRLRHRAPGGGGRPGAALDHRGQVCRRRAAAAADRGDAELGDEPVEVVGELVRRQVVVHPAVDDRRQAGVRQAGDRHPAVGGQVAERLAHLGWPGRAVEPDDVDLHRVERGQGGRDLGARQHPAGQLDRHLHLQRHLASGLGHRLLAGVDDGLGRQQVEDGLDEQEVDAAVEQRRSPALVGVAEVRVGDLAERRELRPRADAAGHPARPVRRRVLVGQPAGQPGAGEVQLPGPIGQPVLGEDDGERAERVGLDHVDADVEERTVEPLDRVRFRDDEDLVAALELRAAEVVGRQLLELEVRPGRAVEDDHPLAQRGQVGRGRRVEAAERDRRRDGGRRHRPARLPAPPGSIRQRCHRQPDNPVSTPVPVTTGRPASSTAAGRRSRRLGSS